MGHKHARLSEYGCAEHGDYIAKSAAKEKSALQQGTVKELIKKYKSYGKIIKPLTTGEREF